MQFTIYAVGRTRGPGWKEIAEEYLSRIRHYVRCDVVELKDDRELIRKWPQADVIVALEVEGERMSSTQFARIVERWGSRGKGTIVVIIGGVEGIPDECSRKADHRMSLSSMTFPHRLAKVVLLEQLYRALTILKGEPYAREM